MRIPPSNPVIVDTPYISINTISSLFLSLCLLLPLYSHDCGAYRSIDACSDTVICWHQLDMSLSDFSLLFPFPLYFRALSSNNIPDACMIGHLRAFLLLPSFLSFSTLMQFLYLTPKYIPWFTINEKCIGAFNPGDIETRSTTRVL